MSYLLNDSKLWNTQKDMSHVERQLCLFKTLIQRHFLNFLKTTEIDDVGKLYKVAQAHGKLQVVLAEYVLHNFIYDMSF